jgi:hypothetical protein
LLNYALAALPAAAVVVEERYGALPGNQHTQPGWLLELVARLQIRYPAVPIVFADSRKLAEEYTYRYLAAALVHHAPDHEQPPEQSPERSPPAPRRALVHVALSVDQRPEKCLQTGPAISGPPRTHSSANTLQSSTFLSLSG